jgi:hypothetical protein
MSLLDCSRSRSSMAQRDESKMAFPEKQEKPVNQYSSGRKIVVVERLASVRIQNCCPSGVL